MKLSEQSMKDIDRAFKALEERDELLDKISAEIEQIETYDGLYIDRAYVFQIIDKYRNEESNTDAGV